MRTSSSDHSQTDRGSGLDRRRFLGLVGAGGVGVAGLSVALPGLAWAETLEAVTLGERINKLAVAAHGDSSHIGGRGRSSCARSAASSAANCSSAWRRRTAVVGASGAAVGA